MATVLTVRDAAVRFGDTTALDDVDLDLEEGAVLAVLGPSGCGKSTLLRAIAGLERLDSGVVRWDGEDLAGVPTHRRGFALMFQEGQLFPHRDVAGNVGYPLRLRRTPRAEVARRVTELLDLVGLPGFETRDTANLSGGERQRVALARALAVEPRLLLLDEPLSALDRSLRERLAGDLREILRAAGTTAVLVTHDHEEAFAVADRMAVMWDGRIVQEGSVDDVWSAPADADVARFLGYARVLTGDSAAAFLAATRQPADRVAEPLGEAYRDPPAVAVRRSALRVADDGALEGTVLAAQATPDQVRLTVHVAGMGEMDAVSDATHPAAVGARVRLTADPSRAAVLPAARR